MVTVTPALCKYLSRKNIYSSPCRTHKLRIQFRKRVGHLEIGRTIPTLYLAKVLHAATDD